MIRRPVLLIFSVLFLGLIATVQSQTQEITVYKTSTCSCCAVWVKHLRENKFTVKVIEVDSQGRINLSKKQSGSDAPPIISKRSENGKSFNKKKSWN